MDQSKLNNKRLRSGERTIADSLEKLTAVQLFRYTVAYPYMKYSDTVADLGCGAGYGSFLLTKKSEKVVGIDDSQETIKYAQQNWPSDKIEYSCMNILDVTDKFDVVIIHEVIEHVKDVEELFKVLGQITKRYLIFTVPSPKQKQTNKFHWKHYHPDEIKALLEKII